MSDLVRFHVIVSGRVQGVGFRFFVIEEAERLGLRGWVRNLPDGRVEAEVDGSRDLVDDFVERLKMGPRSAHVTNVVVKAIAAKSPYTDFRMR